MRYLVANIVQGLGPTIRLTELVQEMNAQAARN